MAQVRTRKRGKTWSYIFEAGTVNGKRKVVEKGGFPTKDAAYRAGVEKFTDFLHGNIGITSEAITLKDFITSWLENVVALNVKPTSMQSYEAAFKSRIAPRLGDVKVQDLTPGMLDGWIRALQREGLSYNTIACDLSIIRHALNYAVYPAQLISSNPADYIKVPKNAPKNVVKRTIITPEQFADLLTKYPFGTPFYIPLLILYHTGMRRSEALSLCWEDIDFEAGRINLHRQIRYVNGRGNFLTTLKTPSSERYILIGEHLLGELERWREQQLQFERQLGGSYVYIYSDSSGRVTRQSKCLPAPSGERVLLICTHHNGQMILANHLSNILRREGLNAHSFRHTHATQLIEFGATPNGVAGRLGHATVAVTQNLYAHNTLKLQEETYAIFDKNLQTNHWCRHSADVLNNNP